MSQSTPLLTKRSKVSYVKTGLGGAGNFHLVTAPMPIRSAPKHVSHRRHGSFSIGIGGAGNSRSYKDKATIRPEQELSFQIACQENLPVSRHCGIGGAGNRVLPSAESSSTAETSSSSSPFSWGVSGADQLLEKFGRERRNSRGST